MKHKLNATGQAAIVQFLENVGFKDSPWTPFANAERAFNNRHNGGVFVVAVGYKAETLTLEPEWFDTAVEPATFDEVVAMLRRVQADRQRPLGSTWAALSWDELAALLARCPTPIKLGENDEPIGKMTDLKLDEKGVLTGTMRFNKISDAYRVLP